MCHGCMKSFRVVYERALGRVGSTASALGGPAAPCCHLVASVQAGGASSGPGSRQQQQQQPRNAVYTVGLYLAVAVG